MAATTWTPAPWLGNQTWLLTDNAVVKTPSVESSTSGRRVRIAGETKSYPSSDLNKILREAVKEVADKRNAKPWVMLGDDHDANLEYHGSAAPQHASRPSFGQVTKFHLNEQAVSRNQRGRHSDIAFEFASEECPTITAIVWVTMHVDYSDDHILNSGITYRPLHSSRPENNNYMFWSGDHTDWYSPFSYYDHGDQVDDAKEFLRTFEPIDGVEFHSQDYGKRDRVMVTDAIKLLRELMDVESFELPVWREDRVPSLMKFKATGRTTWSSQLYRDMLEFVQTAATVDRIKANMKQIVKDMRQLGMVTEDAKNREFFQTVEQGFGDDLACHMIPLTTDGAGEAQGGPVNVVPDHEHTVSIDFKTGTLVVNCLKDSEETINAWNFERFQAELKGELDAFLGFAKQHKQKRAKRRVNQIVKDRTTEDSELDIPAFTSK